MTRLLEELKTFEICRKSQNQFKLKNMQNEIINKTFFKDLVSKFSLSEGMHYIITVCESIDLSIQFAFQTFLQALDTEY